MIVVINHQSFLGDSSIFGNSMCHRKQHTDCKYCRWCCRFQNGLEMTASARTLTFINMGPFRGKSPKSQVQFKKVELISKFVSSPLPLSLFPSPSPPSINLVFPPTTVQLSQLPPAEDLHRTLPERKSHIVPLLCTLYNQRGPLPPRTDLRSVDTTSYRPTHKGGCTTESKDFTTADTCGEENTSHELLKLYLRRVYLCTRYEIGRHHGFNLCSTSFSHGSWPSWTWSLTPAVSESTIQFARPEAGKVQWQLAFTFTIRDPASSKA